MWLAEKLLGWIVRWFPAAWGRWVELVLILAIGGALWWFGASYEGNKRQVEYDGLKASFVSYVTLNQETAQTQVVNNLKTEASQNGISANTLQEFRDANTRLVEYIRLHHVLPQATGSASAASGVPSAAQSPQGIDASACELQTDRANSAAATDALRLLYLQRWVKKEGLDK